LKNNINKKIKEELTVVPIEIKNSKPDKKNSGQVIELKLSEEELNNIIKQEEALEETETVENIEEETEEQIDTYPIKTIEEYANIFSEFGSVSSNLSTIKKNLNSQLSKMDRQLAVIYHRIEFPKDNGKEFNAIEGYNLFVKQREIFRDRRKIKNILMLLKIIEESTLEDYKSGRVNNRIRGISNQKYSPKELEELFESA
jgi:hypothetical protein